MIHTINADSFTYYIGIMLWIIKLEQSSKCNLSLESIFEIESIFDKVTYDAAGIPESPLIFNPCS